MSLYFAKIDRPIPELPSYERPIVQKHGQQINSNKFLLARQKLTDQELNQYIDVIPELKPFLIDGVVTDTKILLPHIHDGEVHTIVNFYLKAENERTSFWEGEVKVDDRFVQDNGNGYWNVNFDYLKPIKSYVAETGDCYLLNPFEPHSVLPDSGDELEVIEKMISRSCMKLLRHKAKARRKIVQMYISLPIEECLERLHG